jgi:hypothetical protein
MQTRGIPRVAGAELARSLLDRVAELSRAFGTGLRMEEGAAQVLVEPQSP